MKTVVVRLLLPVFVVSLLSGCGAGHVKPTADTASNRISGVLHGGQQPVVGASIQLYTVGTSGDGSVSTPLLATAATTDAHGTFAITGDYSCANATEVYLTATGGNPGLSAANPNLLLMAALGPCSGLTANTFVSINELTTVAAAYALGPYVASATSIGSGSGDATALANAFTLANEYVNTRTGFAPGSGIPSGYSDPTALLNTLADMLAACVNTTGGVAGDHSTACGSLFALTPSSGGTAPTDTFTAILNLAQNPGLQTAALFNLVPAAAPFEPALTQVPQDFNLGITATDGHPTLQLSPSFLPFADEGINGGGEVEDLEIFNSKPADVTIISFRLIGPAAGDFTLSSVQCPPGNLLSASGSDICDLGITASPTALGERLAYLQINSTASDSPNYVKLFLSGTNVQTTPSYLYVSASEDYGIYAAHPMYGGSYGLVAGGGGAEYYGALRFDYAGNLYSFGQVLNSDFTTGPLLLSVNDFSETLAPEPGLSFNPTPPAGYLFNGAATSLTGATSHFAADNEGNVYIPMQTSDSVPQLALAVYSLNSSGAALPSFALEGFGGKVAVDGSGELFALDASNNLAEYGWGIVPSSTPTAYIPLPNELGTSPGARVIDLAADASNNVYALIYGNNGYEVAVYVDGLRSSSYLLRSIYGNLTQMNAPTALAVDAGGDIFVADTSRPRRRMSFCCSTTVEVQETERLTT